MLLKIALIDKFKLVFVETEIGVRENSVSTNSSVKVSLVTIPSLISIVLSNLYNHVGICD